MSIYLSILDKKEHIHKPNVLTKYVPGSVRLTFAYTQRVSRSAGLALRHVFINYLQYFSTYGRIASAQI